MNSVNRTSTALRELRYDAGSLVLNLAATVGRRGAGKTHRVERLADIEALVRWCAGVGIDIAADVDWDSLLTELRDLREASWEVLTADLHHKPVGLSTVQRIEAWARADVPLPRLVSGRHGPQAHMAALDQAAVCASVTRDLLALLSDSERRNHLRECASDDCRMIYLLAPGARQRRWCSMSRCGNRAKAAAHRARRSETTASP